jgi:hypothetical protein
LLRLVFTLPNVPSVLRARERGQPLSGDESEYFYIRAQILERFSQKELTRCHLLSDCDSQQSVAALLKVCSSLSPQPFKIVQVSEANLASRLQTAKLVVDLVRELKIVPVSVQQRVLALHQKSGELRSAKVLTSTVAPLPNSLKKA